MISLNIHFSPNERKIAALSGSGVVIGLAALALGSFSLYFFSKGVNHLAFLGNLSPRVISPLSFCFATFTLTAGGISFYFLNKRLSKIRHSLLEKSLQKKEEIFSVENKIFVCKKERNRQGDFMKKI